MSHATVQPLTEEDMRALGLDTDHLPPIREAVGITNGRAIDEKYDTDLDMNNFIIGWEQTVADLPVVKHLFTQNTVTVIQNKVSEYLQGVDPKGRRMMPSVNVVVNALYGVFRSHMPEEVGDIYSKYTVTNLNTRNDFAYIIDKTISLLVRGIRNEYEMAQNNEKLSIWNTVLGDFNEHGLRQYPPIKVREKRPDNFLFHMRY
jgi:hypothetical protein